MKIAIPNIHATNLSGLSYYIQAHTVIPIKPQIEGKDFKWIYGGSWLSFNVYSMPSTYNTIVFMKEDFYILEASDLSPLERLIYNIE